jgi:hypothetical protein
MFLPIAFIGTSHNSVGNSRVAILWTSLVKFIYSKKATNVCEISTVYLCYVVTVKSEISKNFVAFSEYMNFIISVF